MAWGRALLCCACRSKQRMRWKGTERETHLLDFTSSSETLHAKLKVMGLVVGAAHLAQGPDSGLLSLGPPVSSESRTPTFALPPRSGHKAPQWGIVLGGTKCKPLCRRHVGLRILFAKGKDMLSEGLARC